MKAPNKSQELKIAAQAMLDDRITDMAIASVQVDDHEANAASMRREIIAAVLATFGKLKAGKLNMNFVDYRACASLFVTVYVENADPAIDEETRRNSGQKAWGRALCEAYDVSKIAGIIPSSDEGAAVEKKAQRTATADKIAEKVAELGTAEKAAEVVEKLAKVAIDKMTAVVKSPGKDVKQAEAAAKLAEAELTLARKAHDKLVEVNQVKNLEAIKAYAATIADNMKAAKKAGNVDYFRKLAAISC